MVHPWGRIAAAVTFALAPVANLRGEGVVDHVPSDALGFAVMRHLDATNGKFERLLKIFEGALGAMPPAPVTYFKAVTGLGAGIDLAGDAVLALLPGDDPSAPKLLFLAPVADYAALAQSVGGDPSGEITRVTITGEEVLVARQGDYAMIMNVEHRPTMESLLTATPAVAAEPAVPADWLAASDVAVVLMPAGVEALVEMGRAGLDAERKMWEEQFADPAFGEQLASLKSSLATYDALLAFCDAEISSATLSLAIDDATNVTFTQHVQFARDGEAAQFPAVERPSPLAGLAAAPFVTAAGGPMPASWGDALAAMCREAFRESADAYGFQEFDEAQWTKLEAALRNVFAVRSYASAIYAGEKDDPLYSNVYAVARVDDSAAYLASARSSIEAWNELTAASTSDIKLIYELSDVKVAERPALLMTVDVLSAAEDENVPMVKPIIEAMIGPGGVLRVYLVAVDPKTVVFAIATEERAARAAAHAESGDAGLSDAPEIKATAALLHVDAPWVGYISPPGWAAWISRMLQGAFGQLGGAPFTLPEYPAGPPVGIAVRLADGELHAEIAAPVKTLEDLAAFIKACQSL